MWYDLYSTPICLWIPLLYWCQDEVISGQVFLLQGNINISQKAIFKTIMDQAVQYVEPENFNVLSVSDRLANKDSGNVNK